MRRVAPKRKTRSATIPLEGVPSIPDALHAAFAQADDQDGATFGELGELGIDHIAVAATEIRRRQMAKLRNQPDFELPAEMPRWA